MPTIRVNMLQMEKFIISPDNVRIYEHIVENKGVFETLDARPYVEALNEFCIFYTIREFWQA